MGAGWEWDDSLFRGTAAYYRRGRLPYAPGLADVLATVLELDGRGRLIDVGCGPGTLALSLGHLFREVVGVDPDSGMITEAACQAAACGMGTKARWVRARAEELPAGLGTFSVASFGQSFHWMDHGLVAAVIKGMLRPGGALVHVSDLKTGTPSLHGCLILRLPTRLSRIWSGATWGPSGERAAASCRTEHPATKRRSSPGPGSLGPIATSFPADRPWNARLTISWRGCSRCLTPRHTCSASAATPSRRTYAGC